MCVWETILGFCTGFSRGIYFKGRVLGAFGGLKWGRMEDAIEKTYHAISEKDMDFSRSSS